MLKTFEIRQEVKTINHTLFVPVYKTSNRKLATLEYERLVNEYPEENFELLTKSEYVEYVKKENKPVEEHPIVKEFWDLYHFLEAGVPEDQSLNYSCTNDEIAVNLKDFFKKVKDRGLSISFTYNELPKALKTGSKKYRLIKANASKWSAQKNKTVRCWIFKNRKFT